ncbi:hypothetical protein AYO21_07639 [Fonsecaea monophora]|uniref:Uncharacterized protein n=1 Tax=Fonsecaea monophora TaxID=254056 RepID=A0A177F4L5_9EURO|nr:hypothetical protein AYO21_07639 [Fonsecaea monophora]OAG38179.1 hypothetical protein AYO21_07639 [Fonsecaea monophora]
MAGEAETPQCPQLHVGDQKFREDHRGHDAHCIEAYEDRAIPSEMTPEAPRKDEPIPQTTYTYQLPLPSQGRQGPEAVSSDEVQFDFAPLQQNRLDTQYLERPIGVDHRVVPSPESTPTPKVHRIIGARPVGHSATGSDVSSTDETRVSKSPRTCRSRTASNRRERRPRDDETALTQPSDEDMHFFLMYRAREKQNTFERLVEHLKHENQDLRELNEQTETKLRRTVNERDECAEYSELLSQSLIAFKEKYCKLKRWALETNKDCETLQQNASEFQRTLAGLTKDRDYLLTQLYEVRCSSDSASVQMESLRNGVGAAQAMAENSIATIKQLTAFATAQDDHLMSEKQRCRKLEAHILYLDQEKCKQRVSLQCQQLVTNQTLQDISKQLSELQSERVEEDSATDRIMERLYRIGSVVDNNLLVKSDLVPLREDCTSVSSSLTQLEESLSEKVQSAIASLKHDLQHDISTQVSRLLSEVQSGNIELAEAKAEVARLEGKTGQTQQIIELLREAKHEAQKHEAELHNTNKGLRNNREAAIVQSEELRTSLRTVTTKWQTACSELEKCKQDKNEIHADVIDLTIRLNEAMTEHNCLRAELIAGESILSELQQQNEEQNIELMNTNARLSSLQRDHDHEIQRSLEIDDEIARTKAQDLQLRRDLEQSRKDTVTAVTAQQQLQSQIDKLEHRLTGADDTVRQLKETLKSLDEATAELEYLRKQQSSLERLKEESASQIQQIANKSKDIETLQKQLQSLRIRSTVLEEQAREKDQFAEENAGLHNDLKDLRAQVSENKDLQQKLQQKITKIAVLESALAAAQIQVAQLGELERENFTLKGTIKAVTTDLERSKEQCAQIALLQETVTRRESQITELRKDLASFSNQAEELKVLRAQAHEKEERSAAMQQQILTLEGAEPNAKLDGDEAEPSQPQRRVADRSGGAEDSHHNQSLHTRPSSNGGNVQYLVGNSALPFSQSDSVTAALQIVPETQLEVQQSLTVNSDCLILSASQGQEDSASGLSPVPSDHGEADLDDAVNQGFDPSMRQYSRGRTQVWPGGRSGINRHEETAERPPSSSYGSMSEQMLLDQVSERGSQGPGSIDTVQIQPTFAMPGNRVMAKQGPSPRRLRSELRGYSHRSTASPGPSVEFQGNRASTPVITRERERHRPNSAAKRRVEPENDEVKTPTEHPKRLKRTAAILEAGKLQPTTPKQRVEKSSSRGAVSFGKSSGGGSNSSSIVGTNAPGPGQSKRSNRPARKGSRQDKYATRFGTET